MISNAFDLVFRKFSDFRALDFASIRFDSMTWALGIGLSVVLLLALKLFLSWARKKRYARAHSGHAILVEYKESCLVKVVRLLPGTIIAVGFLFLLVVLGEPYMSISGRTEYVESRERIDVFDDSASMAYEFQTTGKAEAEIARMAYFRFLGMRRGQHDRVSVWLFAAGQYKVEDFVTDDDLIRSEVESAPHVIADPEHFVFIEKNPPALTPREKVMWVGGEGGTNLQGILQAVINYFHHKGNPDLHERALLLVTDALTDSYPIEEFKELQRRHIIPYIIFIKPSEAVLRSEQSIGEHVANSEKLIQQIGSFGGKYYLADNLASINQAFRDINKLEKARTKIKRSVSKNPLWQEFLVVSLIISSIGCLLGLIVELGIGEYP